MGNSKSTIRMLIVVAVLGVNAVCSVTAETSKEQTTKWNEKVTNPTLDKDTLAKLGEAFPAWKIKQTTWPSVIEISSASTTVNGEVKVSCIRWLKKFLKVEQLPADIDNHLVPMKNWGVFGKASKQKRLCDVFLVRFTKGPYIIHIQESSFNVVISIVDKRIAKKKPKADHKNLVLQTAAVILHNDLVPDPAKDLFQPKPKTTRDGGTMSKLIWSPPSAVDKDKEGRRIINTDVAAKIGTFEINAETDGGFVRFDIIKAARGPVFYHYPYIERFPKTKDPVGRHK